MRETKCIQPANNSGLHSNEGAAMLTLSNCALLGLGVVFLIVAIVIVVAIIILAMNGDTSCKMLKDPLFLIILCLLLTLLVPLVLWVAVGFQVGLQDSESINVHL